MQWQQVTVTTTSECADLVSMALLELGSDGVAVSDRKDVEEVLHSDKSWDYADDGLLNMTDDCAYVSGFFGIDFDICALREKLNELVNIGCVDTGSLEISVNDVRDTDWANEWRKYYRPIERGKVAIIPQWQNYEGDCNVRVLIEPGMAFGTGRHETTAMCVSLLQKIDLKNKNVLDIGCGSGILGVTALKCGAKHCVMSDIDMAAIDSAKENARLNGVETCAEFVCGDLKFTGKYDVVLANLTADILLKLFEVLPQALTEGGYIVISGLIHVRADEVLERYSSDFEIVERLYEGEWQAMLLERK